MKNKHETPTCYTWQLASLLLRGAGAVQVSGFLLRAIFRIGG